MLSYSLRLFQIKNTGSIHPNFKLRYPRKVLTTNTSTDTIVFVIEANQTFSKVARLVDEKGTTVIMKNNAPRYVVLQFKQLTFRTARFG